MNRIRALREDMDLRQIDVSKQREQTKKHFQTMKREKPSPDSYAIIKLAEFFNVTTDYLLGVSNESFGGKSAITKKIDEITRQLNDIKKHIEKS